MVKQIGIPVARMELLDTKAIEAVNKYSHLGLEEGPTMFFEFHGSEAGVKEQAEMTAEIVADMGGGNFPGHPNQRSAASYGMHGTRPITPCWACALDAVR